MKAIIVEDEKLTLKDLTKIISKNSNKIEIVGTFTNGVDAISYLENQDIDVLFIDINIPLLDGMSLAKIINKFEKKPYIIFITAHKEYAIEAFEVHAFDYILKPYSIERIKEVIERVEKMGELINVSNSKEIINREIDTKSNNLNKLQVKKDNKIIFLDFEDIYFFKANDKYTFANTKEDEYEICSCITDVETKLTSDIFFRTHRSYIVNINKIHSIESSGVSSYKLKLVDIDDEVPVGRRKIRDLKKTMNIE